MRQRILEAVHRERGMPGFWPWLLQRLTGLLLVFLLAVHLWVGHFAAIGKVAAGQQEELVLFALVKQRLAQAFFILVDFSLLAAALYHGLNGVRTVLLEWRPTARRERLVNVVLIGVGVVTFIYGARVLLVFILG